MKKLLCAVALLCAYAGAQTVNPNQIRPGTQDGMVLETVTANQPPTWQQIGVRLTLQHNSTNLTDQSLLNFLDDGTIAPDSGYTLAKFLSNSTGGLAAETPTFASGLQMFTAPPVVGQNTLITPTSHVISIVGSAQAVADNTSGQVSMNTSTTGTNTATVTWHFTLPSGIAPANVTAIYPLMTVEGFTTNTINGTSCAGGAGFPGSSSSFPLKQYTLSSSAGTNITSFTCSITIGGSIPFQKVGNIKVDFVGAYVYYTGTPITSPTYTYLNPKLYYNSVLNELGVAATDLASVNQDGGVTGLLANSNLANPSMTINGTTCTLGSSCTPSGAGTTTNALTAAATGGAAPGTTFNGSAAVTFDYHSFGAPGISGTPATGNCAEWASANTLGDAGSPCGTASLDILSTQKAGGNMFFYPGREYYMTTPGVPFTIFQATGSGYLSNIFFASANISNYQNSVISCSVNGEATPSFTGTIRTLFQNAFVPSGTYVGNYFISTNQGEGNSFSMSLPYNNGIVCTLKPAAGSNVWTDFTAHSGVADNWPYTRKLHTSTIEAANPATSNGLSYAPYTYETLVNYAGTNPGRLAGVWLLDNESGGGGKAALEGNIAVYLDTFNATWKASTAFTAGQIILDPCGNFQTVTTAGTTGTTEPGCAAAGGSVFGDVSGQTTTDGTVTWTASVGTPLNIWLGTPPATYILGMSFLDPNGNVQTVTTAGTPGTTQPTYCTTAGCTTTDGTMITTTSLAATMVTAAFVSTGTEDFFGLGFYGGGAPAGSQGTGAMNGMTANANNVEGFYRYFVNDPIRFTHAIGIIRQIGDPSEAALTVNTLQMAATYFYTQDTN